MQAMQSFHELSFQIQGLHGKPMDLLALSGFHQQVKRLPGVLNTWLSPSAAYVLLDVDTDGGDIAQILRTLEEWGLDISRVQLTLSR